MSRTHFKDWPNHTGFNAKSESPQAREATVVGAFPAYVAGVLYRTGPGFYKVTGDNPVRQFSCSHWFDGFTTIHKFEILVQPDGISRVWYTSRRQVDELVESALKTGRLDGVTFGQNGDPCDSFYKKFKSAFEPALDKTLERVNVGVDIRPVLPVEQACTALSRPASLSKPRKTDGSDLERPSVLCSTTDRCVTKQFDAETLEPLGVCEQAQLHPTLKGPLSGAHAQVDLKTGEVINYNLELGPKSTYRIFSSNLATGQTRILAEISGSDIRGAYIHSMLLTDNFAILCIWPAYFTNMGISILWNRNLLDAMRFDSSAKTTWLVVDRHNNRGVVQKCSSPAFFCFHTVNAWEEPSKTAGEVDVYCELVQFDNMDILHRFYYDNLVSNGPGVEKYSGKKSVTMKSHLTLYRLPSVPLRRPPRSTTKPTIATITRSIDSPEAGDLPRINPSYARRPHRYVWSLLDRGKSSFIDGIGKTDTKTETCLVWEHKAHTPGEPVFIADPAGTDEDDGAILSVVLDGLSGTSYLLCLDAKTMKEIARASINEAVGLGFHGIHISHPQVRQ